MANESYHNKLGRVRPPYVQIRYDVNVGDAIKQVELPWTTAVLTNLSGHRISISTENVVSAEPLPKLKKRKFVQVDRDTFGTYLKSVSPGLQLRVKDTMSKHFSTDGGKAAKLLAANLSFHTIDDFSPDGVAAQIGPIAKLKALRGQLCQLRAEINCNEQLDETLQRLVENTEQLRALRKERENRRNGTEENGQ